MWQSAKHTARRRACAALLLAAGLLAGLPLPGAAQVVGDRAGERVIHQASSRFSPTLLVSEDENGLRVLRFEPGGARQSVVKPGDPDHLELAYARAFPAALTAAASPRRVLVVGLGGGTIPTFLRKRLPEARIDAVDIDPAVVEVARSHFGFREDDHLRAHVGDGRQWIENARGRYDLIVLDAFSASEVPYSLTTSEFLRGVHRALAPDGVVVGNVWGRNANALYDDMVATYLSIFPNIWVMDIQGSGNKLVIASRASRVPDRDEIIRRAGELTRSLALRTDLVPMVRYGLRAPDAHERGGRVLTDAGKPAPRPR